MVLQNAELLQQPRRIGVPKCDEVYSGQHIFRHFSADRTAQRTDSVSVEHGFKSKNFCKPEQREIINERFDACDILQQISAAEHQHF
jgi:hypothetical protein